MGLNLVGTEVTLALQACDRELRIPYILEITATVSLSL
jgi:hypothetical protein